MRVSDEVNMNFSFRLCWAVIVFSILGNLIKKYTGGDKDPAKVLEQPKINNNHDRLQGSE